MKSTSLILLLVSLFSCSGNHLASNEKNKVRNLASYEEMGVTADSANKMQYEMSVLSNSGTKSFSEMTQIYMKRLAEFNDVAESNKISKTEKIKILSRYTDYAERQINKQTHGKGYIREYLLSKLTETRQQIKLGQFREAAGAASKIAKWIVGE